MQRLYYQFKEMEDLSKENMEAARQRARLVERDHSHTKEVRCLLRVDESKWPTGFLLIC
jgi:hypothetical protein